MKFRPHHPQHIAAAKAGFSERTARRMASNRLLAGAPTAIRRRRVADPFDGLWDREIRPMLEAHPGLRPVALLEEMQLRHPGQDWDRLRRSLERRVRTWRAEHGADREVIFRQDHVPGQQALPRLDRQPDRPAQRPPRQDGATGMRRVASAATGTNH